MEPLIFEASSVVSAPLMNASKLAFDFSSLQVPNTDSLVATNIFSNSKMKVEINIYSSESEYQKELDNSIFLLSRKRTETKNSISVRKETAESQAEEGVCSNSFPTEILPTHNQKTEVPSENETCLQKCPEAMSKLNFNIRPELIELLRSIFVGQEEFERAYVSFHILPGDEIVIKNLLSVSFCRGKNKRLRQQLTEILSLDIRECLEEIKNQRLLDDCQQKRSISGLLSFLPLLLKMINAPRLCNVVKDFQGTDRLSESKIKETLMNPELFSRIEVLRDNPDLIRIAIRKNFNEFFDKRIGRWVAGIVKAASNRTNNGWRVDWGKKMRMTLTPLDGERVIPNFLQIISGNKLRRGKPFHSNSHKKTPLLPASKNF